MGGQPRLGFDGSMAEGSSNTAFGGGQFAMQGFAPFFRAMALTQLELMGFANRRAQALFEIPSRASRCRSPHDLFGEQRQFWTTAQEQYAESSRRIMQVWTAPLLAGLPASAPAKRERDYIIVPEAPAPRSPTGETARERHAA